MGRKQYIRTLGTSILQINKKLFQLTVLRWFVAGFGSGWLPKAPGTWGSLAALPVGYWIWLEWQFQGLFLASALLYILGCMACIPVLRHMTNQDPGWIVVDEWVGQWVCMAILAMYADVTVVIVGLSFLAFRLFDIWKPFPIRQVEHWGPAWWSLMFDDVLAGVMGAGLLLALGMVFHVI